MNIVTAQSNSSSLNTINSLLQKADQERSKLGSPTASTINQLSEALRIFGYETSGSYSGTHNIVDDSIGNNSKSNPVNSVLFTIKEYGKTYNLGGGWTYRVDKPSPKGKPHVHVSYKGKEKASENCDGTPSHGGNLDKIPKKIRDQVRKSKDYQKGKKDIQNFRRAKSEIKRRKLNLRINKDLVIAAAIVTLMVGTAYFAPAFLPGFLAII